LRYRHITPVSHWLPVGSRLAGPRGSGSRNVGDITRGGLVESARFDNGNGAGPLFDQAARHNEAGISTTNYNIVIGGVVAGDTKGGAESSDGVDAYCRSKQNEKCLDLVRHDGVLSVTEAEKYTKAEGNKDNDDLVRNEWIELKCTEQGKTQMQVAIV
jgi:hypothetical protein